MQTLLKNNTDKICLALGFFDSVHKGHRKILNRTGTFARDNGISSGVLTFENNLNKHVKSDDLQVYVYDERRLIFESLDIDYVLPLTFTDSFKKMDAKSFLDMLCEYNVGCFVCGIDYRFGENRTGDVAFLKSYCKDRGIEVIIEDDQLYDNEKISSTKIRSLISAGNLELANLLLGENFFILSQVIAGRGEGHRHGLPTANVKIQQSKILPQEGAYACYVYVEGKKYNALTNVGIKPTFDDFSVSVEPMLINFSGDLYGKTIKLEFIKKLRDIRKFKFPEDLKKQIEKDMQFFK